MKKFIAIITTIACLGLLFFGLIKFGIISININDNNDTNPPITEVIPSDNPNGSTTTGDDANNGYKVVEYKEAGYKYYVDENGDIIQPNWQQIEMNALDNYFSVNKGPAYMMEYYEQGVLSMITYNGSFNSSIDWYEAHNRDYRLEDSKYNLTSEIVEKFKLNNFYFGQPLTEERCKDLKISYPGENFFYYDENVYISESENNYEHTEKHIYLVEVADVSSPFCGLPITLYHYYSPKSIFFDNEKVNWNILDTIKMTYYTNELSESSFRTIAMDHYLNAVNIKNYTFYPTD